MRSRFDGAKPAWITVRRYAFSAATVVFLLAAPVHGATPLRSVRTSPDVSVISGGGMRVEDHDVLVEDLDSGEGLMDVGPLEDPVAIDAYHLVLETGDQLLSFTSVVELPGGEIAWPHDVILYDGASFTPLFRGDDEGLPAGTNVDAITIATDGEGLLLSFDTTIEFAGFTAFDADLVAFGPGGASLEFDGSAAGVPYGADLDGAHLLRGNGHLLCSFDVGGTIAGVTFDDDDILEFDPGTWTWQLVGAGIAPADLDALHAQAVDDDGDGHGYTQDCDDLDAEAWAIPGEARDLRLAKGGIAPAMAVLTWTGPAVPGGTTVLYDVLRSPFADDFLAMTTTCVESDTGLTDALDWWMPDPGDVGFFLVRAGNGCGEGTLGGARLGRACP